MAALSHNYSNIIIKWKKMLKGIHECKCTQCQQDGEHSERKQHEQINLLASRLDEQSRRWYVALESYKIGHGGVKQMSLITGMDPKTIWRGRKELDAELEGRPTDRIRLEGGGRSRVEKKHLKSLKI